MEFIKRRLAEARTNIKKTPWTWKLVRRFGFSAHGVAATPRTDICIEGFESSANSYTLNIIRHLTDDPEIAHHTHVAANVKLAQRYTVPTLILYRHPRDAIASLVSRFRPDLYEAVISYITFYKEILPYIEDVLLISFEEATQDTENMIKKVKNKLGVSIKDYESFGEIDREVRKEMREWQRNNKDPYTTPLPTEERESVKKRMKKRVKKLDNYEFLLEVYREVRSYDKR